ncbi:MAG: antitermination protein [Roseibium sp.]
MTKFAIAAISTVVILATGISLAFSGGTTKEAELRRVDCQAITMFTPAKSKSAEDLCVNYGGVAQTNAAPSTQGLVILVRNQPVGGFIGQQAVR